MLTAISQFKRVSEDFLVLMHEKHKQAKKSSHAASELAIMESFYAGLQTIFQQVENEESHRQSHSIVQIKYWQTMCDVLKKELEESVSDQLQVTERPSKSQLKKIKDRYQQGDVTIAQICDHFYVTDDEIKEIINGQKEVVKQVKTG